jgi:glycosyltransferase involved in cell wall biosynthesis
LRHLAFAIPGDIETPTGGYAYDRRIIAGLRKLKWKVDVVALGNGFPFPEMDVRNGAMQKLNALRVAGPVVVDGLALGALPGAKFLRGSHRLVALVHHPLALESALAPDISAELRATERTALSGARHVIVTSPSTARLVVSDYGIPEARISVVVPGTDRALPAARKHRTVAILSVGAMVPRKGHDLLVSALATLKDFNWSLTIAGPPRDEYTVAHIAEEIDRFELHDRVIVAGAVSDDRLEALYNEADVFALASLFEGYGMAYAEAIAHGLPIVGTTAGAIPDTVPSEAGILVPPGDISALADALRIMISDRVRREQYAVAAQNVASALPTWDDAAQQFSDILETVT